MLCIERLKGFPLLTLQRRFGRLAMQAGCVRGFAGTGGNNMIKSELVTRLAERYPNLYHRDVERIVSTVLDEISAALASGDRVELRGFGAFSLPCGGYLADAARQPSTIVAMPLLRPEFGLARGGPSLTKELRE